MSAFGGKADMTVCRCPLSRSLSGLKRTWVGALHMSAFDPKRTSVAPSSVLVLTVTMSRSEPLGEDMRRGGFIGLFGAEAVAWPLVASAQQSERMRRIGVLIGGAPGGAIDSNAQPRVNAFQHELQQLGWTDGRNVQIDYRWSSAAEDIRRNAAEIIALDPDVIVTTGASVITSLLQLTRTVPIVFTSVVDPVGAGFVESLTRPGGNVTGFMSYEYSLSGKWVELLKEIAPSVKRVAVLRD